MASGEWRVASGEWLVSSVVKYRRRTDLSISSRAVFCFLNFVRCFALYRGFVYESGRK